MALRYKDTAKYTYSFLFILPSILIESTPTSINLSIFFNVHKSLVLNIYLSLLTILLSLIKSYCIRQYCAQVPRLPLLAPIKLLIRHCPE